MRTEKVTYEEIYQAFCEYSARRTPDNWLDLWSLCRSRMGCFVAPRLARIEIYNDEADEIIDDCLAKFFEDIKNAKEVTVSWIDSRFWYSYRSTMRDYFRNKNKWNRLQKTVIVMNERIFHE